MTQLANPLFDPTACPACRAPLEALWFCPRDGAIGREGRFTVATHYVAEDLLGGGERSFVYAGHRGGKPVAIKLLRDADTSPSSPAARKFLREARNASQLAHDNTIAIHDFGHDEALGVPFIAMELFSGQSLERVLRTSGPMAVARAVPILVQVARSLGNAHMAGVLHREVTARSVFVGRADLVKVGDYGLGRGDDASGSEADVLGFGRIAVAMLRGRTPAVPQAMLDKISTNLPADLHRLLVQCLDPSVSARPRAPEIEARLLAIGTPTASAIVAMPVAVAVAAPRIAAPPMTASPVVAPPVVAPPVVAPPIVAMPVVAMPVVAPPPVVAIEAPVVPVVVDEPVPAEPIAQALLDSLDDAEPSAGWLAPRRRGWWIACIAVAAAALVTVVTVVVVAASSHSSTPDRTVRAPAPLPAPIASAAPAIEPVHVVAHEPAPPPPAPPPAPPAAEPPAAPDPAPATPATKPSAAARPTAAPSKRAKHEDDAVIVDPFSE